MPLQIFPRSKPVMSIQIIFTPQREGQGIANNSSKYQLLILASHPSLRWPRRCIVSRTFFSYQAYSDCSRTLCFYPVTVHILIVSRTVFLPSYMHILIVSRTLCFTQLPGISRFSVVMVLYTIKKNYGCRPIL